MRCSQVDEPESSLDLHQLVFARLSTLNRLEALRTWAPDFDDVVEGVLEFRLAYGLGELASLQELSIIEFLRDHHQDHEPSSGWKKWRGWQAIGRSSRRSVGVSTVTNGWDPN
ncbi:MAG: hypothetical protein J3Q66DRAFT_399627 [Benniella sp.]|nr:MAG: hypothetical protein J3Q66DRAFT_399627 [Benniella sp.]